MTCEICGSLKEERFGRVRCRACQLRHQREWYLRNKDQKKLEAKIAREKKRNFVRSLKDKPCMDCGVTYPYYVMQFDHRESGDKLFTIGGGVGDSKKYAVILSEVEKCDVVCANCHAIRTYSRAVVM